VYDGRHTFATWAIESGEVQLWYLATIMGSSIVQLEDTYARWLSRTDDNLRAAFDAYDLRASRNRLGTDQAQKPLNMAMRMRGLEPPRAEAHTDLNRARLPIPPHPRGSTV
jgi:hypothetical protein